MTVPPKQNLFLSFFKIMTPFIWNCPEGKLIKINWLPWGIMRIDYTQVQGNVWGDGNILKLSLNLQFSFLLYRYLVPSPLG